MDCPPKKVDSFPETVDLSVFKQKTPQKAIFLAQFKIIHYLCGQLLSYHSIGSVGIEVMTLKGLCKYYISCIALESNTTFRASMKDEKSFITLPWINDYALKKPEIGAFLRGNKDKEMDLLIGYPVLKINHFLSPLFRRIGQILG